MNKFKDILSDIVDKHCIKKLRKYNPNITEDVFRSTSDQRANSASVPSRLRTFNVVEDKVPHKYKKHNIGDTEGVLVLTNNILLSVLYETGPKDGVELLKPSWEADAFLINTMKKHGVKFDDFVERYTNSACKYAIMRDKLKYNEQYTTLYMHINFMLGFKEVVFNEKDIIELLTQLYLSGPYDEEDDADEVLKNMENAKEVNVDGSSVKIEEVVD